MKPIGTGTIKGERYEVFRDQDGELLIKKKAICIAQDVK